MGLGNTCITGLIAGFDPKFSKFAAGSIMMERCVNGRGKIAWIFDFGVGEEKFKAYWSRGNVLPSTSFEIATTRWGRMAYYAKDVAKMLTDMRAARAHTSADKVVVMTHKAHPDIGEMPAFLATPQAPELDEA